MAVKNFKIHTRNGCFMKGKQNMLKKAIVARQPQSRQKHFCTRNGCFIKGELFSLKKAIVVRQPKLGRSIF